MNIDEFIDNVGFGAKTPQITSCLGLYLSPETVYLAEARSEKGRLVVEHLVRIPVPPAGPPGKKGETAPSTGTTLTTDFLAENDKLSAAIRQSISQLRWGTKNVLVTLSHHLGLLRYFTMPAVERQFWKSAVPLEAKKYIPLPFDELSHDFQVVPLGPDSSNRPRQGALVAVTQAKNIASISALLEELDLTMVGIELAPCSVLRLWDAVDPSGQGKSACQVHFDGGNIRILIAERGLPVFFRELFLGAESSLADQRKIDLGNCISFAQKQLGVDSVSQVRVSGSTSLLPQWQEAFSQETGLPVTVQDTAGLLGVKGGEWGGYAAIGAATRPISPGAANLDLGRIGRVTDDERRAAKGLFMIAGVAALALAAVGMGRMLLMQYRGRELTGLRQDPEIEAVFAGRPADYVETLLDEMRRQVGQVQGLETGEKAILPLLKDVVDSLPEKVWLTAISVSNPLLRENARNAELRLAGNAVAPSLAQEQDLAFEFKNRLSQSPVVGKRLPDIQISVSGKETPGGDGGELPPEALAKRLEQRTSFVLTARPRGPGG